MPSISFKITALGPVIDLGIGVSRARRDVLAAKSLAIPPLEAASALIDTGASGTVVDLDVIKALGIPARGKTQMVTPSTGPNPVDVMVYDVSVWLIGGMNPNKDVLETSKPVMGAEMTALWTKH